jgi:M6 family metalloprotease-like protein
MPNQTAISYSLWQIANPRALLAAACCLAALSYETLDAAERREERPRPAPVPTFSPARQPTTVGEVPVGVITITFRDTALLTSLGEMAAALNTVKTSGQAADLGPSDYHEESEVPTHGISQEEYFKIYSNGITWPRLVMMPDESTVYEDSQFYGYYCEYDFWENPIGWHDRAEGSKRVVEMNRRALQFANRTYRGPTPRFISYNYITTRPNPHTEEINQMLRSYYENRGVDPDRAGKIRTRRVRRRDQPDYLPEFDPWDHYNPIVRWGEPMWPNAKIQINDSNGGVFAHELGHCFGAPDVYRIDQYNDGISGIASLMSYGPTANSFSRFYHHGYINQKNHPVIDKPGTYTLHPRHIKPQNDQTVGYLIPSNHPHYLYHVEYVHQEDAVVGVGPDHEGLLIAVVNLGRTSYLGSPDYYYNYRPNDPFFRGRGDFGQGLFGKRHGREEFGPDTEPSSRLPNLLDGGIRIRNIRENQGTLTFDLEIKQQRVSGSAYAESMLPQIRLDGITNIQSTGFTMDCTIKFRGEPLKTDYGFCWSTSPQPTVRDSTYNLRHRECYRGHASNLRPDTTYHVRAYATNGIGVRYSDEELTVRTPPLTAGTRKIEPLCTDAFSQNAYLFQRYSQEGGQTSVDFIGYSPTCVMAKLIAYYRPGRFPSATADGGRPAPVNFNHLNWDPGFNHHPPRLDEIDGFFSSVYQKCREFGFHETTPPRQLLANLKRMTGARGNPVLHVLSHENLAEVSELVTRDVIQRRPVVVIFYYESEDVGEAPRWALIHGMEESGRHYIDFPRNSKLFVDGDERPMASGMRALDELILGNYKTHVITSLQDIR